MNKHLFLVILLSCGIARALAQPILNAANFNMVTGDEFVNHICDTTGVVPGPGGSGVFWNFDSLLTTSIDTGTAVPCSYTPNCAMFSGSNYAIITNATHLIPYYIADSVSLSQNGYYISSDTNAIYSIPIKQFQYPFTNGTSFSAPYAGVITLGGIIVNETGTITVTCDGYGTLLLPGVTDPNVLRVHTSQLFTDSANLFGTPAIETFDLETYSWYMPEYHSPLLTILTTTQVGGSYTNKAVSYSPKEISTTKATTNPSSGASLLLFPNPATNQLNIRYFSLKDQEVRISLLDIMGREVLVIADASMTGAQNLTCNTSTLPKGMYLLRLQSATELITRKIEIR